MARLPVRKEVLRDLAIRSKNKCAFPGCDRPLLNAEGVYIAELCHIEAAEPGGQRFNPNQSDEERRSAANLLFFCHQHHKESDNEALYSVERLREIKRHHECLPEVVFNSELLLHRIEAVLDEQAQIRKILSNAPPTTAPESYSIVGPELQDSWTPEIGRFYQTKTGPNTGFKYMMQGGWLHIEQTLADGAVAYYEVNEAGSVRDMRLPYPIEEYRVVIPDDLVLSRETRSSEGGRHTVRTTLKWSKGTVTEHFVSGKLASVECGARCALDHRARTFTVA